MSEIMLLLWVFTGEDTWSDIDIFCMYSVKLHAYGLFIGVLNTSGLIYSLLCFSYRPTPKQKK